MTTSVIVSEADMARIREHLRKNGTPDVDGTVVRSIANPRETFRTAAAAAGIRLSNSAARKALAKADLIMVQPRAKDKGGGFTMTILAEPAPKPLKGSGGKEKMADPPPSSPSQPLGAVKAYRYLYANGKGKRAGVINIGCWVVDPELILHNKHGEERDVATAINLMVEYGWAEWREEDGSRRFHLLFDPAKVRDSSVAVPPPPPEQSAWRKHGRRGVYLTSAEAKLWVFITSKADAQESGGWDPSTVPTLTWAELRAAMPSRSVKDAELLEVIGRMCAAGILECVAPETYRLALNPSSVITAPLTMRRIVVDPESRAARLRVAFSIARSLLHGDFLESKGFLQAVAENWGIGEEAVSALLFDRYPEATSGSGRSLRLFLRLDDGGLLLVPPSLAGCDFFLSSDPDRKRAACIDSENPQYSDYLDQVRARYRDAAAFEGQVPALTATTGFSSSPPPPPVTAGVSPPAKAEDEGVAAASPAVERLQALLEAQRQQAEAERGKRERAAALRAQADVIDAEAVELARSQAALAAEIAAARVGVAAELESVERQMEALVGRRKVLIAVVG